MLPAQQAWGQGGWVAAGEQGGGWPVGHVVDGAKIQLGEFRRVEEGVAMGWLWGKAPEVPLRIRVWEVVKGMSRVLAEKVESPSRLHVLRGQPGTSDRGLVHRVSGYGERREHPAYVPQPSCGSPSTGEPPLHSHYGPTSHPCPATPHCHHQTILTVLHTQHPPCCPNPQIPPPFPTGPRTGNPSSWRRSQPKPSTSLYTGGAHAQRPLSMHTLPCTHMHTETHAPADTPTVYVAQGYMELLGATPAPNPIPGREKLCLSPTKNIEHAKRTRVVLLQPGVNALPVKLMGARDDPQFLERSGERRRSVSKENHVPRPAWVLLDGSEPCRMERRLTASDLQPSFAWWRLCSCLAALVLLAVSSPGV